MQRQLTQIDYDYLDLLLEQADKSGVKREMIESVGELLRNKSRYGYYRSV